MNKEQEFRKQTEEAKFEAFSLMCKKVTELEKENAELHATNKNLLESCEGATMMYEDLCKAKEILQELANLDGVVYIPMDKVKSLMVKAEKFLKN